MTYVGLQIKTLPKSPEIVALWPKFVARIAEIHDLAEPDVAYGVMYPGKGGLPVLHYMAAVAVATADHVPQGMTRVDIPAGSYAVFSYPMSDLGKGFDEIFSRLLPASGHVQTPGPLLERYDESFDPDDPGSMLEICIPVRA